jgi:hypothetical protein
MPDRLVIDTARRVGGLLPAEPFARGAVSCDQSRQGTFRAPEHRTPCEAMRTVERQSRSSDQGSRRSGSYA